jgi:predicted lipid carrier protein YhbT
MHISGKTAGQNPVFPAKLSLPLKIIPAFIHNKALVTTLNKIFSEDLKQGELDFLQEKIVSISIEDAGLEFRFSMNENRLVAAKKHQSPDLILHGNIYDYLLLASRSEDTDTLFFSRRLHMQGDTELGLYVKNFLDGLDMESHKVSAYLETLLKKSLPLYERLFA